MQWWPYIAVFLLTLATRLPFGGKILYHWDSVNIALGMNDFNVALQQPQPPGYILYIALARLVDLAFANPQTSLVLISTVSSGLAAAAIFALARVMLPRYGNTAGWVAALLLISSPLIWFYGEIALPHTVDLFLVTVVALVAWRVRVGDHWLLPWGAALLAVAGGVRQQTLLFLLPLVIFSVWRVPLRRLVFSALLCFGLTLLWLVPLLMNAGGLTQYITMTNDYSRIFFDPTSLFADGGFAGLWRNSAKLILYTMYGVGFACLLLGLWLARWIGGRQRRVSPAPVRQAAPSLPHIGGPDVNLNSKASSADLALSSTVTLFSLAQRLLARSVPALDPPRIGLRGPLAAGRSLLTGGPTADRIIFLLLWSIPSVAFYTLIHMGQPGLVFTFLPALLLAATAALLLLAGSISSFAPRQVIAVALAIALLNGAVFIFAPEFPMGAGYSRVLSRSTLINHDDWFSRRIAAIGKDYPPANTLLLARDSRIFGYYLPDYTIMRSPAPPQGTDPLLEPADFSTHTLDRAGAGLPGAGAWWVLLPDDQWKTVTPYNGAMRTINLADGNMIALEVPEGGKIVFTSLAIAVQPR